MSANREGGAVNYIISAEAGGGGRGMHGGMQRLDDRVAEVAAEAEAAKFSSRSNS